jgi:hypothetical protein
LIVPGRQPYRRYIGILLLQTIDLGNNRAYQCVDIAVLYRWNRISLFQDYPPTLTTPVFTLVPPKSTPMDAFMIWLTILVALFLVVPLLPG